LRKASQDWEVAISGIRIRDPAKDLKAIEESPKKPMGDGVQPGVEDDAHISEKNGRAVCLCVSHLPQQSTCFHSNSSKSTTKPHQADPRHVGTPEGAAAQGDQSRDDGLVMVDL